jgi:hypothetical protein
MTPAQDLFPAAAPRQGHRAKKEQHKGAAIEMQLCPSSVNSESLQSLELYLRPFSEREALHL